MADEIAYAAHDLEDALSFGSISLGEIVHEFKISAEYSDAYICFTDITKRVQEEALQSKQLHTSEEYSAVLKKELTSTIVSELCRDIGIVDCKDGKELGYKTKSKLALGLKKLLFKAILRKKDVQQYEKRGEKIIRGLFEVYSDTQYNKRNSLLPPELRSLECQSPRNVVWFRPVGTRNVLPQRRERTVRCHS
ncbi:MAG: hypothetical protein ACKN9T_13520 [Candidatus Methylumidiphilus sp.]